MVLQIILADILLVKYPRVLSVKPSNKVYIYHSFDKNEKDPGDISPVQTSARASPLAHSLLLVPGH